MNERFAAFLAQVKSFWESLSTPKRIALATATSIALLGALLVGILSSQISYAYLFTDLAAEDAAAIVQELKKRNVPHRLEANGTAVMVPNDQHHSLRLELAADGLPRGGSVGFELFDNTQIGATEFEQQVSLRRALEGELARSITAVEGVRTARVHLVLPERKLFVSKGEGASASVVVKLANPGSFGKREIAGVVHLVSAAVPGLGRDSISVVSTEGLTLHRPSGDGEGGSYEGSSVRAEKEREVAARMERDVLDQLQRVVGMGNADVRISVSLDASVKELTEEYWDRDTTALRSEHLVQEGVGAGEAGVAGVPGARANLPDADDGQAPAEPVPGGGEAGTRLSRTRNWEVDRKTTKTSVPPGAIQRLSVAVLLNGTYETVGEGDETQTTFVPRSAEQVGALEKIVQRAVGYDEERGDRILVQAAQFARTELGDDESLQPPMWQRYLPYAAAAALALFFISIVVLVWRGKQKAKAAAKELAEAEQVIQELESKMSDPEIDGETRAQLSEHDDESEAPGDEDARVRELALEVATQDPATAALVLKEWLSEGVVETPEEPPAP